MKQLFVILTSVFISISALAMEVPALTGPVVDKANVLSNSPALESQIRTLYNSGQGPQLNILTIPSLNGDNLEQYAHKVFTTWKLGDSKRDDGILFLIVINDRKMRIEVGQGLEGGLTDYQSKQILDSLKSYFRVKDYNGGIKHGLVQIIKTVSQPNAVQQPTVVKTETSPEMALAGTVSMAAIILLFIFIAINRLFSSSTRKIKQAIYQEEEAIKSLCYDDNQNNKNAEQYQAQILSAEKLHHLPLAESIKQMTKKRESILSKIEEQDESLTSFHKQEANCPITKLDSLKALKNQLENSLKVSQSNIKEYQNLLKAEK